MANKIGSTPKEIYDYERGYTDIPIEILYKIAKTLSVNIKALFLGLTEIWMEEKYTKPTTVLERVGHDKIDLKK